jgi:hypothetical protein
MDNLVKIDVVAKLANMTGRRYRQLAKEDIVPEPQQGKVPFIQAIQALFSYKDKLIGGSGNLSLTDERTRLTKAQADKALIDLSELEGELIRVDVVSREAFTAGKKVKDGLSNIPDRISPLLAAESDKNKIYRMLTTEINQVLEFLVTEGEEK